MANTPYLILDGCIGEIKLWAGTQIPQNWSICNGVFLPIQQNQALYAVIGTTYGGDGKTVFCLPNFNDRIPVGSTSNNSSPAANAPSIAIGSQGGESTHTLTQNEMAQHTHSAGALTSYTATLMVSSVGATQTAPTAGASIGIMQQGNGRNVTPINSFNNDLTPGVQLHPNSTSIAVAGTNSNTGGGQPHNNMQPYLGLVYIICTQGTFPVHS